MYAGVRVTDAVDFHRGRGDLRGAVRIVRKRKPEKWRWRSAISIVTGGAGRLQGFERMRVEEPIRELVLDLGDRLLQREVVLDARKMNVDLDRGELLPRHTIGDLRRLSFLLGADLELIRRYLVLPNGFDAPIDTAAVVVIGRAYADMHRRRAQQIWLDLPDPDGPEEMLDHHRKAAQRADREANFAHRWSVLSRTLLGETTVENKPSPPPIPAPRSIHEMPTAPTLRAPGTASNELLITPARASELAPAQPVPTTERKPSTNPSMKETPRSFAAAIASFFSMSIRQSK